MRRLFYLVPIAAFVVLAAVFKLSLRTAQTDELPSALIGRPVPTTHLPPLDGRTRGFDTADLAAKGRVTVVNVFASWCVPCREEAPQLAQLARARGVRLIGFAYKDKPDAVRAFLDVAGNPFERIGLDAGGSAGIDWGISKVPETFIVDQHGVIRGRFGPISADSLVLDILPAIAAAAAR